MLEKRNIKKFTAEEMEILAANPFTYTVTPRKISFTLEFKNIFYSRYENGEFVNDIFASLGYDTTILGKHRIYGLSRRVLDQMESGKIPTEKSPRTKQEKPINVDYNTMPAQQSVSAMQREISYLRQQVEFLKKITELDNSGKSSK